MSSSPVTYRATWNGVVVAESDRTIRLEGNQYFPPDSLDRAQFHNSDLTSVCPWKGTARYYSLEVDGKTNPDAAWYYPNPSAAASQIQGYIAFWNGVRVTKAPAPDADSETNRPGLFARWMRRLTHD